MPPSASLARSHLLILVENFTIMLIIDGSQGRCSPKLFSPACLHPDGHRGGRARPSGPIQTPLPRANVLSVPSLTFWSQEKRQNASVIGRLLLHCHGQAVLRRRRREQLKGGGCEAWSTLDVLALEREINRMTEKILFTRRTRSIAIHRPPRARDVPSSVDPSAPPLGEQF